MFHGIKFIIWSLLVASPVLTIPIDNDLLPIIEQQPQSNEQVCQVTTSDFLFIVDGSTSITKPNFDLVKRFLVKLVEDIPSAGRRLAFVQFSGTPRTEFGFDTYGGADNTVIDKAIMDTPYKTGSTKIGLAIEHAIEKVLIESKGDRPDVPNTVIVITDGRSQDSPLGPAERLRAMGAQTIGLGITDSVNDEQLLQVAGTPERVFKAKDFDKLDDELRNKIASQRSCIPVTQPPITGSGLAVDCLPDKMVVKGLTRNPFNGHLFSKGSFKNESCRAQGDGSTAISLEIPTNACGTTSRRSLNPRGLFIENSVHFKFHPKFTTKADRSIKIACFYMETEKLVDTGIGVSMVTPTNYTQLYPMPVCQYSVHQDSPEGPVVRFTVVGQSIYHKWQCNDTSGQDIFGMRVYDCYVISLDGEKVPLLDNDGCSIDKFIMGNLEYSQVGMMASVETHVFKFTDSANLQFQCQIAICVKFDGGCQDTPPVCPEAPGNITHIPSGRRRVKRRDPQNLFVGVTSESMNVIGPDEVDYAANPVSVLSTVQQLTHDLNSQLVEDAGIATAPKLLCLYPAQFYSLLFVAFVSCGMSTVVLLGLCVRHQRSKNVL